MKYNIQSLYTPEKIDFLKEPIFFGKGKNTQRYDVLKYPIFNEWTDKQLGQDWAHNEISLVKDRTDFPILTDGMKHTYKRTLQRLIGLDSDQGRGMLQVLGSIITLPEVEGCMTVWQHFEISRHSRSYTEILRAVWDKPDEIFDETFEIPVLMDIMKEIAKYYDDTFEKVTHYNYFKGNIYDEELFELKKSIVRFLLNINILEGVRFYGGFLSIWGMHYSQGLMERTSKILQLICRDENLHLAFSQMLLKLLRTREDEGFIEAYEAVRPEIHDMYSNAVNQEILWAKELFKEGSYLGMNADIIETYIKYITNKRLKAINEKILYPGYDKNPCEWSLSYINMDIKENLPQESEVINYKLDVLEQNISDSELDNLKDLIKL